MTWLSGWGKRIKLSIDHNKIDEDLNDFPLLVTLASGVGINEADVNCVFDALTTVATIFNDDFSNGGINWIDVANNADYSQGYLKQINDGSITRTINSYDFGSVFDARFKMIQHGTGSANDQYHVSLLWQDDNNRLHIYMRTYSSTDNFVRFSIHVNGQETILHTNTKYNYYNDVGNWFNVRIVKNGQQGKFKIWKADDYEPNLWDWEGSFPYNALTYGKLESNATWTASSGVGLDDINIISYNSNNKKIMITTTDNIPCYTEIDTWDCYDKKANLWVKIPTIVSGSDTELYLYYDKTQPNNNYYVGETGSFPAQQVWDSNFKAVYHLSQNPTGGTNCIKDSTSNANNGTPQGSMTSDDLVDGKVCKALDFDGSDDYIDLDDNSSLSVSGTFTETVLVYSDSPDNDYHGILGFQSGGYGTRSPSLYIYDKTKIHAGFGDGSNWNAFTTPNILNENTWNLVSAVFDGINYDIYVNGVKKYTTTSLSGKTPCDTPIRNIGRIDKYFDGRIDFVEISNIARPSYWIKTTYYAIFDNLLSFGNEELEPKYYYHGFIKQYNQPVSRVVRLYNRETGDLMDSGVSRGSDGYYYLTTTSSGLHFVVVFDDDAGEDFNALILDRLEPRGIE